MLWFGPWFRLWFRLGRTSAGFRLALALIGIGVFGVGCKPTPSQAPAGGATPPSPTLEADPVVELQAGGHHGCVRRRSGRVACWGANDNGQVGDGTTEARAEAVAVPGVTDAVALGLGERHSCALRSNGQITCWGRNAEGQLGDGRGAPKNVGSTRPVLVRGVSDAMALASGYDHTCAIRKGGQLVCWGQNRWRQLGNDGRTVWVAPVVLSGFSAVTAVATGEGHTCALRRGGGEAVCWGKGDEGQLGDGTLHGGPKPRSVRGTEDAVEVSAGKHHTCIRTQAGVVRCWGANAAGQATGKPGQPASRPGTAVVRDATEIGTGDAHTCARMNDGSVQCWGAAADGRLGAGVRDIDGGPVRVSALSDAAGLAVGHAHACAARHSGVPACWGRNDGGALGMGKAGPPTTPGPAPVHDLNDATEVAAGEGFSCARTDAGKVTCWGSNEVGQLGSGSIGGDRRVPAFVAGLTDIISLDAGFQHACAVTRRGRVHCWGAGTKGQLGEGRNHRGTPVVVPGIDDAVEVSAGVGHTCVRRRGGSVACFGDNEFLQTGSPTGTVTARPFTVPDLRDAVAVSAGGGHSCAVRASGRVACWGQNLFGQLGNGAGAKDLNTARPSPVGVQRIEDAAGIAVGVGHSCARRRTGAVACWGLNDRGQLGGGTESNWSTRTPVKDIRNAVEISSGTYQVCTRLAEGTVRCWGDDGGGARRIPQPAPAQGALGLATGSGHACIVRTTGEVVCWGDDTYGQLGDATLAFETTPQAVHGL